jgi:hypothetical protein
MLNRLVIAATVLMLLAINWLSFHDLFEPHSFKDYLTLAASLLMFWLLGQARAAGRQS